MFFKLGQFYAKHRKEINSLVVFVLWVAGWLVLPEKLYPYYLALTLIVVAYFSGRDMGREEIRDRILGQTKRNGLTEVEEGTEVMGMKWVSRHWTYDNGKELRRINYVQDHWEFEDGTRPERVNPGSHEIPGHWELSDGARIDPTRIPPLEFADSLHDWANRVSKVLPFGIEGAKIGFQLIEQNSVIQKYAAVLEQPTSMFRQESELPFPKEVIRRRLAEGLLRDDLDENMRNAFGVGFTQLEYFLPKEEFDIVSPLLELLQNGVELAERGKRGEDISAARMTLANKLCELPDHHRPVWDKVFKRAPERFYQLCVLKSISSGETDPDMAQLLAQSDKKVDETVNGDKNRDATRSSVLESDTDQDTIKRVEEFFKLTKK